MRCRVLAVLMWKHTVVRIRRFIHTAVDLVSPLLFFILIFAFKNNIKPEATSAEIKNPVAYTDIIPLSAMPAPKFVLYYPDTPLTESLMDDVGPKLNLQRVSQFPDKRASTPGYLPIVNISQLEEFTYKMGTSEALVLFHDMTGESWPEKLNYTIRMKGVYQTDSYESLDDTPGPHKMFGMNYGSFMRLQWAIDTSYIKLLTGSEVPQTLSLQEFPYYHTRKNVDTYAVCRLLMVLCWLSLMLPFVFLMCRLLQERTSGIQELMKMVGVSGNMIGLSHFLNVLPSGLIFSIGGTILFKITSNPLIPNTSGFLIFLMLLLYYITIISMSFVCSFISRGTRYAATLSVMAYVALWIPRRISSDYQLPYVARMLTGMFPHTPMNWFWIELSMLEVYGSGLTFSNMMKMHAWNNCSAFMCYIFMMLQSIFFFTLAWYLSLVRPGQYGQALPWNFCLKAQYWSRNNVKPESDSEEEEMITHDPRYFEPPPAHAQPGIRVIKVSKIYPKHKALKNVTLDVYKGEITVLLGHNGAGKTTLMSIITGMTSATEGKVYVNGKDTVTQRHEVRQNLGLCPQHNLFFPDLTVQEHIMFFTLLKQGTYSDAKHSSRKLADRLSLSGKLSSLPHELSGGMKRRAQLACALAGGADVLVLDEPTSGLDVETRRELWDLLLSLRGERTVLLTTHFMEEADALGDRVAALHAGSLRCFATTMHLKKAVGTGYRLSFTTIGFPKEEEITKVVTSYVNDASVKEQTINTISYNLPATATGKFPRLFSALESKRSELGIDSIGVGASTLEEVFLKLCSDVDTTVTEDEADGVGELQETAEKLTGPALYFHQLIVLLKRQVRYAIHKKWTFLILQVILPVLMIVLMTWLCNNEPAPKSRALPLELDVYADRFDRRVLYHLDAPDVSLAPLRSMYPRVTFTDAEDVAEAVLRAGEKDVLDYNKYLVGVEVNETDAKILYTTTVRHAAPVALNLLSNVLATRYLAWADGRTVTTLNEPIEQEIRFRATVTPKDITLLVTWGVCVTFIILATNINCISLPCKERQTGSRHIHIMCGCPAELHWSATLLFHVTVSALALVVPTLLAAYFLDGDSTIDQLDMLGVFALVLILGTMAFLALMYLVSFNFGERTTSIILVACIIIFGILTPFMKTAQEMFQNEPSGPMYIVLSIFHYIAPPHTMVIAALKTLNCGRVNALCKLLRGYCPTIFLNEPGMDLDKCCAGKNPRCYFCIDKFSPGEGIIILAAQFIVLMTLVMLTQRGVFNGLLDKLWNVAYRGAAPAGTDDMVRAESTYVSKAITTPAKQITDAMLVDNLHKNYVRVFRKNVNAVKGISFSVKKGECFGLLGVNGAGKSTTFKMLTAEECATKGNIFGNGHHLRRGNSKYLQTLGYCPQFFGLDMFQTGEENLSMVLTLRGYEPQRVKQEVKAWIQIVGLEKYAQRRVEAYSGGCVRRLGAAAALCGGARLALLDEPSAGVDVAARRRLWAALRAGLRHERSVIITSHSMDEMEALCSRIAILAGGRVRALGTAAALRARHAAGHAVVLKVSNTQARDEVDGSKTQTHRLKEKVLQKFNCTLKDEHKTMLHYHINETMRYSELFSELEALRREFPLLIEDYSVTETTLEEVFLSFAREQHQEAQTA